jgi:UDP-N-acetylmuramoyl-tripeptide--D-alanyl-D-alanine ligase
MKPRLLSEVATAVGGLRLGEDALVTSVATDSREVVPGALFFALAGEHVDGHRFVGEAFERGAHGVIVRDGVRVDGPAVHVRATGEALLRLAADERDRFDGVVVGITGANGKTSTKDMAAAVSAAARLTHASPASFNNEIGLPVTLLGAPPGTDVIVAELGARHEGDVALLCRIARPSIVVVTNVGVAHMEVFGSWEAIVEASAEPVEALGPEGVAILNADDHVVAAYRDRCAGRVVTFGAGSEADVRASDVSLGRDGRAAFVLETDDTRVPIRLGVPGDHMVPNALAAVAVGLELGVEPADAVRALDGAEVSHWRMETFTTGAGVRVVNDAYNANPESMAAALKTARWMAGEAALIAVLGPMAELGDLTLEAHERVGELAARLRVDRLVTVGPDAEVIAVAGVREGVPPDDVASYPDVAGALDDVRTHARPGDLVLVTASRVAGLERLAEALR